MGDGNSCLSIVYHTHNVYFLLR